MKKILAILLALTMLLGLSGAAALAEDEVVTLKWVSVGNGMPQNYDSWAAKLNAYLEEKIGVHVEMETIGWGDWDNRRSTIVNTNEPFDIIFGNDGTFNNDVRLGALMEITEDMLKENAPGLLELTAPAYWDACRIDGKIYAVPTVKDTAVAQFFVWDKDLLDANGLTEQAEAAHSLQEIEPILYALQGKTDNTLFELNSGGCYQILTHDSFSCGLPAVGVALEDEDMKVVATFEQEKMMEDLKLLRKWYNDGIINADAATRAESNNYRLCYIAQGWPSAAKTVWGPNMGVNAIAVAFGVPTLSTGAVQGSLNSISVNCKHPDKALQLLNLVNTDPYVRDTFAHGEEGVNWEYAEDGRLHLITPSWDMPAYTQGTFFTLTQLDTEETNQYDELKVLDQQAVSSVLMGFAFDSTPVADELASCIEIYNRYRGEILTGTVDPTDEDRGVPAMMKEMRDAGFDAIVTEAQAQIDAWKAAK